MRLNLINILLVLVFVFGIKCAKLSLNSKCDDKTRWTVDKQIGSVFPVLNGVKVPENEKQLQKYCISVNKAIHSTINYIKSCAGKFGPLLAKAVLVPYNKEFNSICKSGLDDRVGDLLDVGQCVNRASKGLNKCGTNMLDSLMALQSAPDSDRINMGCCHAHKFASCVQNTISKTKRCNKDIVQRPEKYGFDQMGDMMSELCGEYYGNNAKCNELIAKTPKLDQNTYVRPKSIFMPLINILDSYRTIECTVQTETKMDKIYAQLLTIGQPEKIPENQNQLAKWCKTAQTNAPFMYGYIESCLSDFGVMLAKVVGSQGVMNFQPVCAPDANVFNKPNNHMQEYIKAAKCGNRAENKILTCFDGFIDGIMGIIEAPDTSRIRMACCNAYKFRTCLYNGTSSTKGCALSTVEWAERSILEVAQPAINLVCAEHWNSGYKCQKLLSEIPALDTDTYVRPKSVFMPFMKLLDSFPDVELDSN